MYKYIRAVSVPPGVQRCARVRLGWLLLMLYRSGGGGHQLCTTERVCGEESAVGCRRRCDGPDYSWSRASSAKRGGTLAGKTRRVRAYARHRRSRRSRGRTRKRRSPASVGAGRTVPIIRVTVYARRTAAGRAFGAVASRGHLLRRGQARLRARRLARRRARRRRPRRQR